MASRPLMQRFARWHIWLGWATGVPLLLWAASGVVMVAKPIEEVHGDGVVGEQPRLEPGEAFTYTSGAVLSTAVGTMEGSYDMVGDDGAQFDAPIPPFTLSIPRTLH